MTFNIANTYDLLLCFPLVFDASLTNLALVIL
jgi:hypothetical protein